MTEPIPRTVTYADRYERQAAEIEPDARRLDEMIFGAEWVLARTPLRGDLVVILNPGGSGPRVALRATVGETEAVVTGIGFAD